MAEEAVIYTAHYDHFGIRPEMPGDNIFNGAQDNATGCGILLELARAFGSTQARTGRFFSRPSRLRSRDCWAPSIWGNTRRSRQGRSHWI